MSNPQWIELPMSRTNFHGPKDVRAIKVRLYTKKMRASLSGIRIIIIIIMSILCRYDNMFGISSCITFVLRLDRSSLASFDCSFDSENIYLKNRKSSYLF